MNLSDVLFETLKGPRAEIGLITLNRPQFLNALTQEMSIAIDLKLMEWEAAINIKAVVIRGAGDRAFCAGGDIKSLYALRDQPIPEHPFFWHEYRMNARIHHFKKPYIALLDGVTLGGGVGLSIHGSHPVATEKLKLAMPETSIGFFPDVGGSYFLPRCRGKMGWYLGLTGQVLSAADACAMGLVRCQVLSENGSALVDALVHEEYPGNAHEVVDQVMARFSVAPASSELITHQECVDYCFAEPDMETIISRLQDQSDPWANEVVNLLLMRSPTSLKVACEQLRRGATLDFDACMQMEYRMALHFLHTPDFFEGVRAAVIDKDRSPRWNPADLSQVKSADVLAYFS